MIWQTIFGFHLSPRFPVQLPAMLRLLQEKQAPDWRDLISCLPRGQRRAPLRSIRQHAVPQQPLLGGQAHCRFDQHQRSPATPQYSGSLTALADANLFEIIPIKPLCKPISGPWQPPILGQSHRSLGQRCGCQRIFARCAQPSFPDRHLHLDRRRNRSGCRQQQKNYFSGDMAKLSALTSDDERVTYIYQLLQREFRTGGNASWVKSYGKTNSVSARSLAAAADGMFARSRNPGISCAQLVHRVDTSSMSTANGRSLISPRAAHCAPWTITDLIDLNPGSTLLLTQVMRPGASYYNLRTATVDKYFSYTYIAGTAQANCTANANLYQKGQSKRCRSRLLT